MNQTLYGIMLALPWIVLGCGDQHRADLLTAHVVSAPPDNVVLRWNELALATIRQSSGFDAQGARLYAMVNVAMYDAINGITAQTDPRARAHALIGPQNAPPGANKEAAAAAAAHAVLVATYPARTNLYDAALTSENVRLGNGPRVQAAAAWGENVGREVVALRMNDGSSPVESQPGGAGPGEFRANWSNVQYRALAPFAIADSTIYVTIGPPALESVAYAAAIAEVRVLGDVALTDAGLSATFAFWAGGPGTVQPPGEWIRVAIELARGGPELWRDLGETARMMTLLSMAMADVVAPTYATKHLHHFWRPATAIREADSDGNAHTDPDPAWMPRAGGIGSSPEHVSGHSAFAGAAAETLRGFFCSDDVAITFDSDSVPGAPRSYATLSAIELEAGRSRVYGGIHFEFSNRAGLDLGHAVAREVLATRLLLTGGPTHFGSCPR